jgi:hypothetical protein
MESDRNPSPPFNLDAMSGAVACSAYLACFREGKLCHDGDRCQGVFRSGEIIEATPGVVRVAGMIRRRLSGYCRVYNIAKITRVRDALFHATVRVLF